MSPLQPDAAIQSQAALSATRARRPDSTDGRPGSTSSPPPQRAMANDASDASGASIDDVVLVFETISATRSACALPAVQKYRIRASRERISAVFSISSGPIPAGSPPVIRTLSLISGCPCAGTEETFESQIVPSIFRLNVITCGMLEIIGDHASSFEDHSVLDNEFWSADVSKDSRCRKKHNAVSGSNVSNNDAFHNNRGCSYVGFHAAGNANVKLVCLEGLAFKLPVNFERSIDEKSPAEVRILSNG